ncbi:MAG: DUF2804 domain-containing protein [Spirochaetes bacterium]|nr:DUF2804 domain-containing protein [Spirochaetota bacterium]MBU1080662.1 DUF2804 domain-containing protein [Spirochaetota bacterium]
MRKIIGEGNRVNYGCIDEPVEWNVSDFKLLDFFDREVTGLRKKLAYHKFNFMGINSGDYAIGFAVVDLGFLYDVFAYLYHRADGLAYSLDVKLPKSTKAIAFPDDPDNHRISVSAPKCRVDIVKDQAARTLAVDCDFEGKLAFSGTFPYGIGPDGPLRVLNPSFPTRWTFTEKYAPLVPTRFELRRDGRPVPTEAGKTAAAYDWTGGYLRRETNWYWTSIAGILPGGETVGANFAAFVNETYYPENAFWAGGKRTRVPRVIYDFDPADPYSEWRVFDEDGLVDLRFRPYGERADRVNLMPLTKYVFRQFVGTFSGRLRDRAGNETAFESLPGFCETHRSVW